MGGVFVLLPQTLGGWLLLNSQAALVQQCNWPLQRNTPLADHWVCPIWLQDSRHEKYAAIAGWLWSLFSRLLLPSWRKVLLKWCSFGL